MTTNSSAKKIWLVAFSFLGAATFVCLVFYLLFIQSETQGRPSSDPQTITGVSGGEKEGCQAYYERWMQEGSYASYSMSRSTEILLKDPSRMSVTVEPKSLNSDPVLMIAKHDGVKFSITTCLDGPRHQSVENHEEVFQPGKYRIIVGEYVADESERVAEIFENPRKSLPYLMTINPTDKVTVWYSQIAGKKQYSLSNGSVQILGNVR